MTPSAPILAITRRRGHAARCRSRPGRRRGWDARAWRRRRGVPGAPRSPPASRPNARASARQGRVEGEHPAAVDRVRRGLDAQRAGHGVGHRALQRMRGVEVALDRPALDHAQGEAERVLARAVVVDAPRRSRQGGGRHRVARRHDAAGQVPDAQARRRRGSRTPGRRARATPPCDAQASARWRSSSPRRSSTPARTAGSACSGLAAERRKACSSWLAVGQPPDEAVLALDAPAAFDDDPAAAQATTVSAPGQTPKTASAVSPM